MVRLKVTYLRATRIDFLEFQFLMVRLKAVDEFGKRFFSGISIPYGAIKSSTKSKSTKNATGFQFLMVRLKAIYVCFCL